MYHAVGLSSLGAEALHLVLLVGLEVTLEPVPLIRVLVGALPSQDVGCHAVQEPTIVRDDHCTAGEFQQRIFQGCEGLNVQVVGGLVEQQQVTALLEGQRQVQTVTLTTGGTPAFFCWSGPLKPNAETYAREGISTLPT